MGLAGKGPKQQQWLTYRDQEVYRNIVRQRPALPAQLADDPGRGLLAPRARRAIRRSTPPASRTTCAPSSAAAPACRNSTSSRAGSPPRTGACWPRPPSGRAPTPTCWWTRTGSAATPAKLEVYGYASWSPRKGIVMLRNPDDQPREFALDVGTAFELPPGAPTRYTLKSPWAEDRHERPLVAEAGKPLPFTLAAVRGARSRSNATVRQSATEVPAAP